jgi:LL-diaminopimelate aminotransferase
MTSLNPHLLYLRRGYLFFEIDQRLAAFRTKNPGISLLNLGVGDIALPLAPSIVKAIQTATAEMGTSEGIHGYGPGCGYPFLRKGIAQVEYQGLDISFEEIFISDGINSDICHIRDLFSREMTIAVADPTYPLYVATSVIDGFTGPSNQEGFYKEITYLFCGEKNDFLPLPPEKRVDIVYLCSPNNPVGTAFNRTQLKAWVDWAIKEGSVILYDGAYSAFIKDPNKPKSIYEIPGAKQVAIEFRSFSKSAGFTGLRLGYTVVPKEFHLESNGKQIEVRPLWELRQETKTNGVSYPIQRGAEAALFEGREETENQVSEYQRSGEILRRFLEERNQKIFGGEDSPYIFWKIPRNISSWDFFQELLEKAHIIAIPGRGFGIHGEGFMRISTFCSNKQALEATRRLRAV